MTEVCLIRKRSAARSFFVQSFRLQISVFALISILFGTVFPAPAQIQRLLGLDVSAWQGSISQTTWNNIRTNDNRRFVVIRSSRGGTSGYYDQNNSDNNPPTNTQSQRYDDPYFIQNINRATSAGMFAGSYHFSRPDVIASTTNSGGIANTGTDEADHFIQMASPWMRPGYLVPVHDFEAGDGVRTDNELTQFCIDFSNRIYERMGIRPSIYVNGNYCANILQTASVSLRDQIAKPPANVPSVLAPCYPTLWVARWPNQTDPNSIDVQGTEPKDTYSGFYGPWDDYPGTTTHPWHFWQYASTAHLPSYSTTANLDVDAIRGGIEFLKDLMVPAVWTHDGNGDWSTLTNWNSGLTPTAPVTGPGQVAPVATGPLPTPRLPGGSGTFITSGTNDTVILERSNVTVTVTISTGTHNIRKLYVREALNMTGGSLTVNYVPSTDSTTNGAVFSGAVALSNSAAFSVHTLQVDTNQTFTVAGGTVTLNTITLMPHSTTPAKILITGNISFNQLANASSIITNGSGAGTSGRIDLGGADRTLTIGNGTSDVDLSIDVPIINGGLTKAGAGTLRVTGANTYASGTTISAGRLLVNNTTGSGTGAGAVTVNSGATLAGSGTIAGVVTVNSGGTLSPGTSIGALTNNSPPVFNGTNFVEIDRNNGSPSADKIVLTSGTLTYGGTLAVTNIGAALVNGDVFTLFLAPAYAGSFAATLLPDPGAGLSWDLTQLTVDGTIRVVSSTPAIAPSISTPPQNLTVIAGDNATFSVTAAGTAPLSYQWRFNGVNIPNATQSDYTRTNAQPSNAGSYAVVVTNSGGSITSAPGVLTVNLTLAINSMARGSVVKSPDQATYAPNTVITLTATANTNYGFFGWTGDASGTNNPLQVTMTTNKVINAAFLNTSGEIILDNPDSEVSYSGVWQSGSASLDKYGSDYRFSSTAAGGLSNATYRPAIGIAGYYEVYAWYPQGVNRATNAPWTIIHSGGNTNVAVDQTTNGGSWRLLAPARMFSQGTNGYVNLSNDTGSSGKVVMADGVRFLLATAPSITNQPQGQTVFVGQNATFNASAIGTAPLSYQWRFNAANIPGATESSYTRTNTQLTDAGSYSVVVTNVAGSVTSSNAVLNVTPLLFAPSFTTHPDSLTVTQGDNAIFTSAANANPSPTYQWRRNGVNIFGATNPSYTRTNAQPADAGSYTVVASNVSGMATSALATLTVRVPPSITSHPENQIIGPGGNVIFLTSASGDAPLGYQWRFNGTNILGATQTSYQVTNAQAADTGSYSVLVTNPVGSVISSNAQLIVITTQPAFETIQVLSYGQFRLQGTGAPGNYEIEFTTNFTVWNLAATVTNSEGTFEWIDPVTNGYRRYYRAKWIP
jgi:autotransporter-associated beta strand protein